MRTFYRVSSEKPGVWGWASSYETKQEAFKVALADKRKGMVVSVHEETEKNITEELNAL